MQKILNLKLKNVIWIYLLTVLLNIFGGGALIYFSYENFIFPLVQKVSEFLVTKSNEENLDFTLVKGGMLESSKEEFLISAKDFPIELPKENFIYISNQANLETLKSKNTLIALNNNKIFSQIEGEYLVIDIWEQFSTTDRVSINTNSINNVKNWVNENKTLQVIALLGVSTLSTLLYLAFYFFTGYFILRFLASLIFKLSNKVYSDLNLKIITLLFLSIYNVLDPLLKVIATLTSLPFPDIFAFSFLGLIFILIFSTKFQQLD